MRENILIKYITGELPAVQRKAVEDWINASAENRAIAERLHEAHLLTNTLQTLEESRPEEALHRVKARMSANRKHNFWTYTQRIAALLFLPLVVACLYSIFTKEEPIRYTEVSTNPGMVSSIELSDGSKVWLNTNSTLRYPNRFEGDLREVTLTGEAYFEIQKQPYRRKKRGFVVHTQTGVSVEVVGTAFNVDAYPDLPNTIVSVAEGAVNVRFFEKNEQTSVAGLSPHEKLVYNILERSAYTCETEVVTETCWKEGTIILRASSLEEVVNQLCKRYNINITIQRQALNNYTFTGVFNNLQLERVLEHLHISSGIRYEIKPAQSPSEKTEVILH